MSRQVQVTFDDHNPQALSSFGKMSWVTSTRGPPGVTLSLHADPLVAWDEFLTRVGIPDDQRNARSAIEDPDGHGSSRR